MVGKLTGMTTTIINGACGIGINAGHRTNTCPDNIRFQGPEVLYATTTSDVVVVLQYVTPYICTGAYMYSITLQRSKFRT